VGSDALDQEEDEIERQLEDAEAMDMNITLEGSVDDFDQATFIEDMAAELDIDPSRIEDIDVTRGSIKVKFKVAKSQTPGAPSLPAVRQRMRAIAGEDRGLGGYQLRDWQTAPVRQSVMSGALSAAIFGKKLQSRASSKNPDHWQREDTPDPVDSGPREREEEAVEDNSEGPKVSHRDVDVDMGGYSPERGLGILVRRAEETQPDGSVYIKVTVTQDGERLTREELPMMDPEEWRTTQTQMGKKLGVLEWEERQVIKGIERNDGVRLVFEFFESSFGVEDSIGWCACSPFHGGEKNEVNTGANSLSVFKYPLKLPPIDAVGFGKATLIVECYDPASPPEFVQLSDAGAGGSNDLSTDAWVVGIPAAPSREPWDPEEDTAGIDLYVDGCRFLPDCVTVTKITVYLMSSTGGMVAGPFERMCMTDRSAFEPVFALRKELRNARTLDYSTTLFCQLDTVEAQTKDRRVVGYAVHNLFVEPNDDNQATSNACRLNTGNFQIPLHVTGINPGEPVSSIALDNVPRVPCATLLVRILPAVTSKDGLRILNASDVSKEEAMSLGIIKPPPKYSKGAYDARRSLPDATERHLYQNWLDRPHLLVKDRLTDLADTQQKEDMTKNGKIDHKKLDRFAAKLLKKPPLTNDMPMRLSFFAKYSPEIGFRISVDGCQNLPSEGKYVSIITSLSPPGLFYRASPLTEGVQVTRGLDMESEQVNPRFPRETTTKLYQDIQADPNTVLIVDVRCMKDSSSGKAEQIGWTLLSLFTEDGYCRTGNYQIPLFKGKVKPDILEQLKEAPLSEKWPEWLAATRGPMKLLQPASVYVRLCDAQLGESILTPFENIDPDILPPDAARDPYLQKEHSAKCADMVPGEKSHLDYLQGMDKAFSNATDIDFDI